MASTSVTALDRPYPPPLKALRGCAFGMLAFVIFVPLVLAFNICYYIAGDDWLGVFFPYGLIGDVVVSTSLMMWYRVRIAKRTVASIRAIRGFALLMTTIQGFVYAGNISEMLTAPNEDVFATFLMNVILLTALLPLPVIFWVTISKTRWFDPYSRPDEWEHDQGVASGTTV
jgi:hypothetical protein